MLLEARKRKGWTLRQLEQASGINRTSLCMYEQGKYQPTQRKKVEHLASLLDIPLDALLAAWHPYHREQIITASGQIWCSSCHQWKHKTFFNADVRSPTGHQPWCQVCSNE